MGVNKNGTKNGTKNGINNSKPQTSNKSQQITKSPNLNQTDANCFFGIKSYIKDFYAQKGEYESSSDEELIIDNSKGKKLKNSKLSSTESETETEDELRSYKKIIKNCDKLKRKSGKKILRFIDYSRELFSTNDSENESSFIKKKKSKSKNILEPESQKYKSYNRSWSVYVWRSILIIGCMLLISGLLMAIICFLLSERPVVIGKQEEMEIIDRNAIKFNQILNQSRAFSLALISIGSLLSLSTLLLPTLVGASLNCFIFGKKQKDKTLETFFNNKSDSDEETCSKIYVKCDRKGVRKNQSDKCKNKKMEKPIEDNISKIPTLEQIETVQPERERDEMILTSEGFAKLN